jgi:2-oxoglutarate/2-oxoacid ferredoxin oxidoreductase subunit beta
MARSSVLRKLDKDWDPLDRSSAMNAVLNSKLKGEILTGLLYMVPETGDLHDMLQTSDRPLYSLSQSDLCPGSETLAKINEGLR